MLLLIPLSDRRLGAASVYLKFRCDLAPPPSTTTVSSTRKLLRWIPNKYIVGLKQGATMLFRRKYPNAYKVAAVTEPTQVSGLHLGSPSTDWLVRPFQTYILTCWPCVVSSCCY